MTFIRVLLGGIFSIFRVWQGACNGWYIPVTNRTECGRTTRGLGLVSLGVGE